MWPIFGCHIKYSVCVDIKGHLDLRYALGAGGIPERLNIPSETQSAAMGLSPYNMDGNCCLVIGSSCEDLTLFRRNCSIAFNQCFF